MPNITIKDIARKFKCSPSTVSRALNNYEHTNIETRNTIQEYAQKMGYQRNSVSLSLLQKNTKTLGIVLPNISQFHESAMVEGLQSVLQPLGYLLNICVTNESYSLEKEYVERLMSNRVDGIFISIAQETYSEVRYDHLQTVMNRNVPLIFIDRQNGDKKTHCVSTDDYLGAYMATEHLIKGGYKRIAHLRGPLGVNLAEQRFNGYRDCLFKHNYPIDESLVSFVNFNIESAIEPTKTLLALPNPPDAIFGVNDQVCFGAFQVIREKGLKVPEEIAVIGFDNTPISAYFYPSLSTIARKSKPIGEEAAKLFLNQINQPTIANHIVLPPELIVRNSSSLPN
jgi:DNA-binding LacI/PurR family transcriptional regulator